MGGWRCSATRIRCMHHCGIWINKCHKHCVRTTTTTPSSPLPTHPLSLPPSSSSPPLHSNTNHNNTQQHTTTHNNTQQHKTTHNNTKQHTTTTTHNNNTQQQNNNTQQQHNNNTTAFEPRLDHTGKEAEAEGKGAAGQGGEEGGGPLAGGPPQARAQCRWLLLVSEDEEEEEEKETSSRPLLFRPRSSSTSAVLCASVVTLVQCLRSVTFVCRQAGREGQLCCGCARRRLQQLHVPCWFYWCAVRAVFPSFIVRSRCAASWPVWTRTTVMAALAVSNGSGMFSDGFVGYAPRAVFSFLAAGPRCSASWPVWTRMTVSRSSSIPEVACARLVLLVFTHRDVLPSVVGILGCYGPRFMFPFCCRQAQDARHHGQYGSEGQLRVCSLQGHHHPCLGAEAFSHGPDRPADH